MRDNATISSHLNEFNSLFSQLTLKGLNLDDEIKTIFLLCSLPSSWDIFCIAIGNFMPRRTLIFNDVMSAQNLWTLAHTVKLMYHMVPTPIIMVITMIVVTRMLISQAVRVEVGRMLSDFIARRKGI